MGSTLHLYLIRHAESENNARPDHLREEDPSITSRGVQQAEHLADWMATHRFDLLVTSPFRRALQTAAPTVNRTGCKVEVWCDVYERGGCYVGWQDDDLRGGTGLGREAIVEMIPGALLDADIAPTGWWAGRPREADADALERAARVRSKLESRFADQDQHVALITHAEFQRMLIAELVGHSLKADRVLGKICNAGVTYVTYSRGGADPPWQLQWFNAVTHLPSHLITGAKG